MPQYSPYTDISQAGDSVANTIAQIMMQRGQQRLAEARAAAEARMMQQQMQESAMKISLLQPTFDLQKSEVEAGNALRKQQKAETLAKTTGLENENTLAGNVQKAMSMAGTLQNPTLGRNPEMQAQAVELLRGARAFPQGQVTIPLADLISQLQTVSRGAYAGQVSRSPAAAAQMVMPREVPSVGVDLRDAISGAITQQGLIPVTPGQQIYGMGQEQPLFENNYTRPYSGRPMEDALALEEMKNNRLVAEIVNKFAIDNSLVANNPKDAAEIEAYRQIVLAQLNPRNQAVMQGQVGTAVTNATPRVRRYNPTTGKIE